MCYHPATRSRAYREDWCGRRRNYKCRKCGVKFQRDTSRPVPPGARICASCLKIPENMQEYNAAYDNQDEQNGLKPTSSAENVPVSV